MAGADYDGIEGIFRVAQAGQKPDTFAVEVLTFHAAIEYEIEVLLRKILPRADALLNGTPRLSFAHKAKVLNAVWQKNGDDADKLSAVLHAFQNLRDAVAHSDRRQIKSCNANLSKAYRQIAGDDQDDYEILDVAQGICLFMADHPTLGQLAEGMKKLDALVNGIMPRALGAAATKEPT